jgi:hypothetical protein
MGDKHYCGACRARQCPECRHYAGHHGPRCRYLARRRRPQRITVYGVVSSEHVIALFTAYHAKAVRVAQYVGGLNRAAAEDVVRDVFLAIWSQRDLFATPPRAGVFLPGRHPHRAPRAWLRWTKYTVAMDPADLVLAEQPMYKPSQPAVVVPV